MQPEPEGEAMAEQSRSPIKLEHKFDALHFVAVLFAVLLIRGT
jgi:hypothetical protein